MKPSAWVVVALCLYLLIEAVLDTRSRGGRARVHAHRIMIIAIAMTLVAATALPYERGF